MSLYRLAHAKARAWSFKYKQEKDWWEMEARDNDNSLQQGR